MKDSGKDSGKSITRPASKHDKEIARLKAERERLKHELRVIKSSFSLRLGSLIVLAVAKPGRNTLFLPYRLIHLLYRKITQLIEERRYHRNPKEPLPSAPASEKQIISAKTCLNMARGLWQHGLLEEAEKRLQAGVARYPENRNLVMTYAEIAAARQDWPAVEARLRPILDSGKVQAEVYALLGQALREKGSLDKADEVIQTGLAMYPRYFDLSVEHAKVAIARQDWQVAYKRLRMPISTQKAREQIASELPLLEYGSINEGITQWGRKWREASPDHRVLMIAPKDFAGSLYKLAEAVNRHTPYAVRIIVFEFHPFGYPVDLVVPECDDTRLEAVFKLTNEAAIFHLKDEQCWVIASERYPNLRLLNAMFFSDLFRNTPKVFTHYGGFARKFKQDADYIARVKQFEGRIVLTPDLNFDWFNGIYIPHAIDTDKYTRSWSDSHIMAHSPSNLLTKTTDILKEAVAELEKSHQDTWRNWSLDIIHGVPYDECMARKRKASLFFDQAGGHGRTKLGIEDVIGWYGNSAVEAMAFGIPTIAHLSEIAIERAGKASWPVSDIPIINVARTRDSIVEAILSFARKSSQERKALSERTRQFTVDFHSYKAVGERMAQVYDELPTKRKNVTGKTGKRDKWIMGES